MEYRCICYVIVDYHKECSPGQTPLGTFCIYDKKPVLKPYRGSEDWRTLQENKEYAEDYEKYWSKSVMHRN